VKHGGYAGDGVDVYPVGLLHDLRLAWGTVRHVPSRAGWALGKLGRGFGRGWRNRSYWNGYLAEPTVEGQWTRCGHGWTRRRALRDLNRHVIGDRDA
jgi:hypothetical protein